MDIWVWEVGSCSCSFGMVFFTLRKEMVTWSIANGIKHSKHEHDFYDIISSYEWKRIALYL